MSDMQVKYRETQWPGGDCHLPGPGPRRLPLSTDNSSTYGCIDIPDDPAFLPYLAGLIDGEGCITRQVSKNVWKLKIAMMDQEVIEWLASFGGTVSSHHRQSRKRREFEWYLMKQDHLYRLLSSVLPFMRVEAKRAKVRACLQDIDERRTRRREALKFSHHAEVAPLDPDSQERVLEEAACEGWSVQRIREEVKDREETNAVVVKTRICPTCNGDGRIPEER